MQSPSREDAQRIQLFLLEKELAQYWLEQSYVKPEVKRAIRKRLVCFRSEIRRLLGRSGARGEAPNAMLQDHAGSLLSKLTENTAR
jgi:hypothetical protein